MEHLESLSQTLQPAEAGHSHDDSTSARVPTCGILSPQFCLIVFSTRCAAVVSTRMSMSARLQLSRAEFYFLSAWKFSGRRLHEEGLAGKDQLRAMCGGLMGLLSQRVMVKGASDCRYAMRLMTFVVGRAAAARAAATAEGFYDRGQREYTERLFASAAASWGRAVELKHWQSHALLSNMLFDGRQGVPEDTKRALEIASAGASMGACPHSKGMLGRCYVEGLNRIKNENVQEVAKGFALGRESAAMGSCFGQFVVALVLFDGLGVVAPDDTEAARWLHLAAEQGLAVAQYYLASLCLERYKRNGVVEDNAEALRLLRLAAAQGLAPAQFCLGMQLQDGDAEDKAEAKRFYNLASDQGYESPCTIQ
jgi:TPR repeat protein